MRFRAFLIGVVFLALSGTSWATVSSSTSRIQYDCNGSTTEFTFSFGVNATSEIDVVLTDSDNDETTLTETTHYSISATNNDYSSGGTVTTVSTYASGYTITILRDVELTQESDFTEGMATLYETFEDALDKNIRIDQQQQEELDRTPKLAKSSEYADETYTFPDPESGKVIGWNSGATDLTTFTTSSGATVDITTLERISDYSNDLSTAVSSIGSSEKTLLIDVTTAVTDDLTVPSNITLWFICGGVLSVASGKTLTIYSPNQIIASLLQQIFAGSGTIIFSQSGTIHPFWYPGADLSVKVQKILDDQYSYDEGDPLTIVLPSCSKVEGWDWGTEVDVDMESNITIRGDGMSIIGASAAITRFFDVGTLEKVNKLKIHDITFNARTQTVTEAIRVCSASRHLIQNIGLYSDAGSFTYGITFNPGGYAGSEGEGSSGFDGGITRAIYPGGDGDIDTATVYSVGGQINNTIENIRACDGQSAVKVYLGSGYSFQSNTIRGTWGDSGSSTAMVDLDIGDGDAINENVLSNIHGAGKYGIAIKQRGTKYVQDNIVLGIKLSDWDTQAIYVEDAAGAETYRDTYIRRNNWNGSLINDAGAANAVQIYAGGAWSDSTGNRAVHIGETIEGATIWDSTNGTIWSQQDGSWESPNIKFIISIADNTAYRIPIPTRIQTGFFAHIAGKGADNMAIIAGRAETSAHCTSVHSGTEVELGTGALTGETGTDGKFVIQTHTDGYLYLENRRGSTLVVNVSISQ